MSDTPPEATSSTPSPTPADPKTQPPPPPNPSPAKPTQAPAWPPPPPLRRGYAGPPAEGVTAAGVAAAEAFQRRFMPKPGVDYGWVEGYARQQHEYLEKAFDALDAKAAALLTYQAGGTGLFTFGALAALSAATVSPYVVLAAVPAGVAALLAACYSALARRPTAGTCYPPSPEQMAEMAEFAHAVEAKTPSVMMIPLWQWCAADLAGVCRRKAGQVDAATRLTVWSVGLLLLPVAVALCRASW